MPRPYGLNASHIAMVHETQQIITRTPSRPDGWRAFLGSDGREWKQMPAVGDVGCDSSHPLADILYAGRCP